MTMSRPAPEDPPIIDTIRLGVMAMHLVTKFLSHFLILRSKKPYICSKIFDFQIQNNLLSRILLCQSHDRV